MYGSELKMSDVLGTNTLAFILNTSLLQLLRLLAKSICQFLPSHFFSSSLYPRSRQYISRDIVLDIPRLQPPSSRPRVRGTLFSFDTFQSSMHNILHSRPFCYPSISQHLNSSRRCLWSDWVAPWLRGSEARHCFSWIQSPCNFTIGSIPTTVIVGDVLTITIADPLTPPATVA
jgi:hypothetical protein